MRTSFFLTLTIIALAGCTTTSEPTIQPMSASVNGNAWSAAAGIPGSNTVSRSSSNLVIVTGVASDSSHITLFLMNPAVGTDSLGANTVDYGTYSMGVPDTSTAYITNATVNRLYSGSVTITSFDSTSLRMSGQFNFVARKASNLSDSVTVSNGSFIY